MKWLTLDVICVFVGAFALGYNLYVFFTTSTFSENGEIITNENGILGIIGIAFSFLPLSLGVGGIIVDLKFRRKYHKPMWD